tara:strand:- start:150 stop:749 length:600 start_codon:yes stop_codon:yes gene_type:complete
MDNEVINFRYYNWGPLLYSSRVTPDRVTKILEICNKAKKSYAHNLAGHLKKEVVLPALKIFNILNPYFGSYTRCGEETKILTNLPLLIMESAWVNYMEAGDFNPPHNHDGELSFVLFLKVPDKLKKENEEFKGTSIGPGAIEFRVARSDAKRSIDGHEFFPTEGDIFIFPSHLEHWVYPFKSKITRISVSGNLGKKNNA